MAYCTSDDVTTYLPNNLRLNTAPADPMNPNKGTITTDELTYFINAAAVRIDSILGGIYEMPAHKINWGGTITYPYPLTVINAILAAQMVYEQKLQGADRERSESQKAREVWAEEQLMKVQNGEIVLAGQRAMLSSRFVSNTLYPAPKNTAEGGRSKGSNG